MVIKLLCVLPYNVLSGSMVWHAATHYYGLFNPAWHGWSSNYCVSSLTISWVDLWCGMLLPIIMACLILLDMVVIKLLCVLPYNVLRGSMVWHAATHYYGLFNPAWHGWSSNYCVSSLTMSWTDLWCGLLLPIIMACLILLDMDGHQTTVCPPLQCPEWIYGVACCYPLLWLV